MIPPLADPVLRAGREDEADALTRLSELAVAELCRRDYPGDLLRAARRVFRFDPALFGEAQVLVAEHAGTLLGATSWSWHVPDDPVHRGLPRRRGLAYLRGVFVHPSATGRGIGSALVRACECDAQRAGAGELALCATFTSARLYSRLGYRRLAEFEIALPGCSVPCLQMARALPAAARA